MAGRHQIAHDILARLRHLGTLSHHLAVAVDALEDYVEQAEAGGGARLSTRDVEQGLHRAMQSVLKAARTDPGLAGMVTTVTMLLAEGRHGVIGHAGDSRAYLIRRNRVHQLTEDHEFTDAIPNGSGAALEGDALPIQTFALQLLPGDTLVLCTDGAEQVVVEPGLVRAAADLSPALLASRIVSAAHRADPAVDATAVVVRVRDEREPGWLELSEPTRRATFGHTLSYA